MSLKLRPATLSDVMALAEVYFSAFSKDPISILVFPRGPSSLKFWTDMLTEELTDPTTHYLCIYDSSLPSAPIISFGKWNSPAAPLQEMSSLPTWPDDSDTELANHFFGTLFKKHVEIMGDRKHWYLETLATRKEHQGRGAARMLIRWGLEKADEDMMEAFLEGSPEGKPIYEKYGFVEKDRLVVDLKGKSVDDREFVEVFMVRQNQLKEAR